MATSRVVNTNFWKDNYVIDLDPIEKLLFLYLLTNPRTNIAGIYEVSLREIAFDTGIDKDMVQKVLLRFRRDKKAQFINGWMILNNWQKHQVRNPKVEAGIDRIMAELPDWLLKHLTNGPQAVLAFDEDLTDTNSLYIDYRTKPNLTKLNLTHGDNKLNKKIEQPVAIVMSPEEREKALEASKRARQKLAARGIVNKQPKQNISQPAPT